MDTAKTFTLDPTPARVVTISLSMATIAVLEFCLTRRIQFIQSWRTMPFTSGLIIAIYVDSFLFIFCTAVLSKAYSLNSSIGICDGAILLCLLCYLTTKILIYYFLVEKVHIIRSSNVPRLKCKLWCFNFFGVICPFVIIAVVNFVYRMAYFDEKGICVIGIKRRALVPLISFDVVLNVYLTSLFLHPLRKCYSYKHNTSSRLRTLVVRTFVGSCTTLAMSVINLSILTGLNGEPGYVCLALCNFDILFSICVLHWATSTDRQEQTTNTSSSRPLQQSTRTGDTIDIELQDKKNSKLTTRIEVNRMTLDDEISTANAIEVKTQHVREVEVEPSESGSDVDTRWARNDSQERIVST